MIRFDLLKMKTSNKYKSILLVQTDMQIMYMASLYMNLL
jgi:hypothetical protein